MKKIALLVLACLLTTGCTHSVHAPIPGAVNQFDSDTYLTLVTAKATIDQAKTELQNGAFTVPSVAAAVKTAVNGAITAYNVADTTYQAYHTSAVAGQATPAQQNAVVNATLNLNASVAQITAAKGAK